MTDPALALSFVDHERDIYGTARSGFALLFEDGNASSHDEKVVIEAAEDSWNAKLPGDRALTFTRVADAVELGGMRANLCSVAGDGIDGLGVIAEIHDAPRWSDLSATRYLTALCSPGHALIAHARRPASAQGHGEEMVIAHLWSDGELRGVEDARLSTIYDGEGRPRRASLELWLPGEDFPRRAFGTVTAGASLALEGLDVHAAAMSWKLEGQQGAGLYELTVREPAPTAA
jgi:hypothetical protein